MAGGNGVGGLGTVHNSGEIAGDNEPANSPGGKQETVVGSDIFRTKIVSGERWHKGKIAPVAKRGKAEAGEEREEAARVPEKADARHNGESAHTEQGRLAPEPV